MDCSKCLEENKRSIETKGYGYGYIGKNNDCQRHKPSKKWTNNQSFERSKRK